MNSPPSERIALLQVLAFSGFFFLDRAGLGESYGNQAVILREWGRLGDAMALAQKTEAIFTELSDSMGLVASYGNQMSILRDLGSPDEALAILQKQEAICVELGDRAKLGWI